MHDLSIALETCRIAEERLERDAHGPRGRHRSRQLAPKLRECLGA